MWTIIGLREAPHFRYHSETSSGLRQILDLQKWPFQIDRELWEFADNSTIIQQVHVRVHVHVFVLANGYSQELGGRPHVATISSEDWPRPLKTFKTDWSYRSWGTWPVHRACCHLSKACDSLRRKVKITNLQFRVRLRFASPVDRPSCFRRRDANFTTFRTMFCPLRATGETKFGRPSCVHVHITQWAHVL